MHETPKAYFENHLAETLRGNPDKGKTINAIRTLLMSVASRNGLRVNLEIIEDEVKA